MENKTGFCLPERFRATLIHVDINSVMKGVSADLVGHSVECDDIIDMALDALNNLEGFHRRAVIRKPLYVEECARTNIGYPIEIRVSGQYIPQVRVFFKTAEETAKMAESIRDRIGYEFLKERRKGLNESTYQGPERRQRNPQPEEILQARSRSGLTQSAAAALVYKSAIAWKKWESGERRMPPDTWELFLLKI